MSTERETGRSEIAETGLTAPVAESARIQSLDVLRGFAVFGILLLNILGFGMLHASYSNPGFDLPDGSFLDVGVWATVELFAEGAMRALFSILFGAGVVLFTTGSRARGAWLHYRRTFWLLVFGLVDAYLLLWSGDILVVYALAGALLYWLRNLRARWLLVLAAVLILLMSALHGVMRFGLGFAHRAAVTVEEEASPDRLDPQTRELAAQWNDFAGDFAPTEEAVADELAARRGSYLSAFRWNAGVVHEMLTFVLPVFLFWDALAMMLVGMALFELGVLQGERSARFYRSLAISGFAVGLAINGWEVSRSVKGDFALFDVFGQMQITYHLGRLAVALGWLGLVVQLTRRGFPQRLRRMLAAVGRMALTNYLMHSLIAVFLFTGAGLALVGRLGRAELYLVVLAIWVFQLFASEWWMERFRFGPLEWLWRCLTYGAAPAMRRR